MNIWKIYGIKKWFIISLIALSIIWSGFFVALVFYFYFPSSTYIYFLVFFAIYATASIYYLLKQSLFRFLKYRKCEGEEMNGKITYSIPSTGEVTLRPLAIVEIAGEKRVVALLGMFDYASKKQIKEGDIARIYKIKGEQIALLMKN